MTVKSAVVLKEIVERFCFLSNIDFNLINELQS